MDDIKDRFKNSAENFSLKPSEEVWTNIESKINNRKPDSRPVALLILIALLFTGLSTKNLNERDKIISNNFGRLENTSSVKENKIIFSDNTIDRGGVTSKAGNNRILIGHSSISQETNKFVSNTSNRKPVNKNVNSNLTNFSHSENELALEKQVVISGQEIQSSETKSIEPEITTANPDILSSVNDFNSSIPDSGKIGIKMPEIDKGNWSLSFSLAPSVCMPGNTQNNLPDSEKLNISSLCSYNVYLKAHYKISKRIELNSGIALLNTAQKYNSSSTVPAQKDTTVITTSPVAIADINDTNGYNGGKREFTNQYSYLNFSLGAGYSFLKLNKFKVTGYSEIGLNYLLSYIGFSYNPESMQYESTKQSMMQTWLLSINCGVSFQYDLSKRFSLAISPGYNCFLHSVYKSSYPEKQNINQAELRISLRYYLIKS
jgi:hypothetical protein